MAGPREPVAESVRIELAAPEQGGVAAIQVPVQEARFVRLVIRSGGPGSVGLDEVEVFGPEGEENLALATCGATARASSVIAGYAIHSVAHLNDGLYGNDHSWIAATNGEEWAEIELPAAVPVARITFSRDRTGRFTDRQPREVEARLSLDGETWQTAARQTRAAGPPAHRLGMGSSNMLFSGNATLGVGSMRRIISRPSSMTARPSPVGRPIGGASPG
jgi:hypothetical protein